MAFGRRHHPEGGAKRFARAELDCGRCFGCYISVWLVRTRQSPTHAKEKEAESLRQKGPEWRKEEGEGVSWTTWRRKRCTPRFATDRSRTHVLRKGLSKRAAMRMGESGKKDLLRPTANDDIQQQQHHQQPRVFESDYITSMQNDREDIQRTRGTLRVSTSSGTTTFGKHGTLVTRTSGSVALSQRAKVRLN